MHSDERCSRLSPYSKLPRELVRLIILSCLPRTFNDSFRWAERTYFRLQITQVCAFWRSVAFSMPELWQIRVPTPAEKPVPVCKTVIQLTDAWFRQCSASHVGLTMVGSWEAKVMFPSPVPVFDSVFAKIVIPYASRFRSLSLLVMSEPQWKTLSILPLASLVTLTLDLGCLDKETEPLDYIVAPSLRSFQASFVPAIKLLRKFPWKQLTSITLSGYLTTDDISQVLAQCVSLQACDLGGIREPEDKRVHPDRSLVLPHLNSLSIGVVSTTLLGWLPTISTPRLSSLTLFTLPDAPHTLRLFTSYVTSISNTLRCFEVRESGGNVWKSDETLLVESTLRAMPWVTHLYLSDEYPLSVSIMERVGTGDLIPYIESIRFAGRDNFSQAVDLLVPPQSNRPITLKSVIFSSVVYGSHHKGSRIRELAAKGVNISIEMDMFW